MPGRDGTGPKGQGPRTGRGMGRCGGGAGRGAGRGMGRGQNAGGPPQGGQRQGSGPDGFCICPGCGEKIPHKPGVPCSTVSCPKCGMRMGRE